MEEERLTLKSAKKISIPDRDVSGIPAKFFPDSADQPCL